MACHYGIFSWITKRVNKSATHTRYPTANTATSTYRTPLVLISAGLDDNPVVNTFCLNVGGGASYSHGNTGSTTPGATGASSSLLPYKTIYMW